MADGPATQPDPETVGGSDHHVAMSNVSRRLSIPAVLLEEAIAEARAVGRHRIRAVPARRIDELVTKIAEATARREAD